MLTLFSQTFCELISHEVRVLSVYNDPAQFTVVMEPCLSVNITLTFSHLHRNNTDQSSVQASLNVSSSALIQPSALRHFLGLRGSGGFLVHVIEHAPHKDVVYEDQT